ncbi:hypothetical protein [Amycolatopsis tucumanensis]|uniref:Uncharacterized protein n=1 Tax=Amycolatopsis tucumanensis TaxID=401106 RepID=A0ABP7IG34_9PSEU|nr:hypothetical protein [Amycolatopsis tucumanensis]MCF6423956.1 hypothetical protein [Amycolatopsis tucumanensis]
MTEQLTFRQVLTTGLGRIIHYGMRRSMALGWQGFCGDLARADGEALLAAARETGSVLGEIIAGVSVPSLVFLPCGRPFRTAAGPRTGVAARRRRARDVPRGQWHAGSAAGREPAYQRGVSAHAWAEVRESYRMAERLGGRPWPGN